MQQDVFFRYVFGGRTGYVCVAIIKRAQGGKGAKQFKEYFFQYPGELDPMLRCIEEYTSTHDVYYCPQLLDTQARRKENIKETPVLWADLDECPPSNCLIPPSVTVESSPRRYQALWRVEDVSPADAEMISQRIAYYHEREGADVSGWDLSQLLRVPLTYNRKPEHEDDPPIIKVLQLNRGLYRAEEFLKKYPAVTRHAVEEFPFPENLPDTDGEGMLDMYLDRLPPQATFLFTNTPEDKQWSIALWSLELVCFEAGMSREEAYILVRDSACNKFKRDHVDHERLLWRDVCRAWIRNEENIKVIAPEHKPLPKLLTPEERQLVASRETFVERYIRWASSLGDAAPQYHQAGAFIALSAVLSGGVRLPTSFGTIKPNLWFMILADTTLTRKSTAMDISMDLVAEVDDGAVLATDGSVEGLLGSLATRPGRPSVFLRDEFSGMLEAFTKKDHYAGMAEMFTKLYDGKLQKRVLRKETIEVRDPVLVMFTGGIRNKICGLLTHEHIGSGFVPRFVFITAESDLNRVKPIGPPTQVDNSGRAAILAELRRYLDVYQAQPQLKKEGDKLVILPAEFVNAELTPKAWDRYNKLEHDMMKEGIKSQAPEIVTPTFDRLCKSMLKAAVLIAASRQDPTEAKTIQVTYEDMIHAMSYGEQWRNYVVEVVNSVGKTSTEQEFDRIFRAVVREPGVTRSKVMQHYHLTARQADTIFTTLEQRGLVLRKREGRTERLFPVAPNVKVPTS